MTSDTITLAHRRQFFAEEIEAVARLRSRALVDALAAIPREKFLPPGPWSTLGDADLTGLMTGGATRYITTPDTDPKRVYHNIGIAIDPARQLFNGQPATLATWIDALALAPGQRVMHVGAGLGYYTAVMAHCVGPTGHVLAYEVDEALATSARGNLASHPWVEVRHGDASQPLAQPVDAILVNAGATHPLDVWLDGLGEGGRLMLPLTTAMPVMGATLGKGLVWLVVRTSASEFTARVLTVVAVYSALGVRDDRLNERIGKAMMGGPMKWAAVTRLRRDAHDEAGTCWLHGERFCLSS
jgi:protein-L-isoaspartate(D-aspartate) O-methyltransferase